MTLKSYHRFSVDDYDRMIEGGILTENDRVELIRGEILEKMPIGDPHCACVKRLNKRLGGLIGDKALIGVQDPILLDDSEPEPDVVLLRPRADFYESGKPQPADIFLLIEVADTTLDFDRDIKLPLYAEAGIREYWIVNLIDDCVEIHRDPQSDGSYRDRQVARSGEHVALPGLAGIVLAIADAIGH